MYAARRLCAGIVCALLISGSVLFPVSAANISDLKNQQSEVKDQIKEKEAELKEKKNEQAKIFDRLQEISGAIEGLNQELAKLEREMAVTEQAIEETEKELEAAQKRLEERTQVLGARLKEIYKKGEVSYLEVLLEATDFSDFLVRYHLLEKIAEQDMDLIAEIQAERQAIQDKQAVLEANKAKLISLEQQAQARLKDLEQKRGEQKAIMASLETEKQAIEKGLRELEAASRSIASRIRAAQSTGSAYKGKSNGRFITPVGGSVTSNYGWRTHPILGTRRMHTGIDIGASSGTSIKAADNGAVIFAGWLGAYGNAVVIDHGGGLSTLYGHMSSIGVGEGAVVSQGQSIGRVGSTGWSTGPHLHFEVRQGGEPVNPWGYL